MNKPLTAPASLALSLLGVLAAVAAAHAQDKPAAPRTPSVFDLPRLQQQRQAVARSTAALFQQRKYAEIEKLLTRYVATATDDASALYNLACARARLGNKDSAFAALDRAITVGFRDAAHIQADPDLASLREDPRFKQALEQATKLAQQPGQVPQSREVQPAGAKDGVVLVDESNTVWDANSQVFRSYFKLEPSKKPVALRQGAAGELLRRWAFQGNVAGNHGDVYDNQDGDHSNMRYADFPQLTRVEYSDAAKKRGLHYGLQLRMLFNAVTIGNSSTARTRGPYWRSQARAALTSPRGAGMLYVQYRTNHLYMYPEHRDHDPIGKSDKGPGHGDVFAANTPYMVISQGSSGSDRVFLNAVAATLAAFHPDVKAKLKKHGMLMPTLQMILRKSNKTVRQPGDYFTGQAHPTVFDGKQLNPEAMVKRAHALKVDALPPLAMMRVEEENEGVVGRDYFDVTPRERLFDTPCAIARVVKSSARERRLVVNASASLDIDKRELTYRWVVLRGDAKAIRIRKLDEAGSRVEITVPHHDRRPIAPGAAMTSDRVDIGLFVSNGVHDSPPAFLSLYYLANEKRTYDDAGRILAVDYTDANYSKRYVDPVLDFRRDWRDEYDYDKDGKLLGWTRKRGQATELFTADGRLVQEQDLSGKPSKTAAVRYVPRAQPNQAPRLEQVIVQEPATAQGAGR